jgi:hypothetical protein
MRRMDEMNVKFLELPELRPQGGLALYCLAVSAFMMLPF